MKFSIKGFSSKCDQIRSFLWVWSHLLEKSLMENFIFCAVLGGFEIYWSVRWKCVLSVIYLKMAMNLTLKHKNGVKTVFFMVLLKSEYIHKPDIIGIPVFGYPLNCTKFHRQFWQFLVNILLWKFDAWF